MLNETPTTLYWALDFLRCFGRMVTPSDYIFTSGEVLEWLKRHAWKACKRQKRFGGSNPPLSAGSTLKLSSEEIKEKRKYRNFNELRYFSFIHHCPSRVRREYPNTPKRLSYVLF